MHAVVRRLVRSILCDKPRVTRFPIEWDPSEQIPTVGGDPSGQQPQEAEVAAKLAQHQQQLGQGMQALALAGISPARPEFANDMEE